MSSLSNKILNAAKWSTITEIVAKLIMPITNMILARILAPEVFGVITTVTMVISFADMFTDAGFQKYLVQHEFKDENERNKSNNVAFWSNFFISLVLWGVIVIFSEKIALMVGNPGLGNVIAISCIQLPLTSFSSIQMAVYRRNFDFKTLFLVRLIGICIPFFVTIPLAFGGYGYWAMVIGSICGTFSNAIILTFKSKWKPQFTYSFTVLREMISFSIWSLIEAISIWLTSWVDTFIIGSVLNEYYLGIYKTSLNTVNSIFSLITASTTPVLFSALSRLQENEKSFNNMFFYVQRIVAYLVLPMSIGMFIYSELVVKIFLGSKWEEASGVIGVWALSSGIVIILGHYCSEVYRAKGKPKLSFVAQILHLVVLVPVCMIGAKYNFIALVNIRALVRIQMVLVHLILIRYYIGIKIFDIIKNVSIPIVCSIIMGSIGLVLKLVNSNILWEILSVFVCMVSYLILLMCFKSSRSDLVIILSKIKRVREDAFK